VQQHLALLHHAYLYWDAGGWIFRLTKPRARELLSSTEPATSGAASPLRAFYLQLPERMVWAELEPGAPHQPMDGMFVRPWPDGGYFVLAVFGMHPGQPGFTVVEADGYLEGELLRADGSAPFAPLLPGGMAAGLFSIAGAEELLELAARTVPLVEEAQAREASTQLANRPVDIG
jgi:hypothetical protein